MERNILYAKLADKGIRKGDRRKIGGCVRRSEHFRSELEKLAAAPRLRLFVAEAVYQIEQLERHGVGAFAVLDDGADDARRPLRTQGEAAPLLILEGVHLLLDNVGRLSHAARKKPQLLKGGDTDLGISVPLGNAARRILDPSPFEYLRGKNISRASRLLIFSIFTPVILHFTDITVYQNRRYKSRGDFKLRGFFP